jgi:exonuclease SbcD
MRFIHTADWHLGRLFHGIHLTEEQAVVVAEFIRIVQESKADAVIVAGDVFDRMVPPSDAVRLLDETLSELVMGCGVHVIVTAGNHDSADRLAFGSRLMASAGLHIVGSISVQPHVVTLTDEHGPVSFFPLPFLEPEIVRESFGDDEIRDQEAAMAALTGAARCHPERSHRNVLIAHTFVRGGNPTESERPLSLGGSEMVSRDCMTGFQYVALGHLHRRQVVDSNEIRYSGSIYKYSFSEAGHEKSVNLVEMDETGTCTVEQIPLVPGRDVRVIRGHLQEILEHPDTSGSRDDYVMVSLLGKDPVLDAMGKIREVYPNALHLERPDLEQAVQGSTSGADHRKLNDIDLFQAFFTQVTGDELTPDQRNAYEAIVDSLRKQDGSDGP